MRGTAALFTSLVFVLFALSTAWAQMTITGVVIDSSGAVPAHAFVEAIPRTSDGGKGTVGDRLNPWTPADVHGRFTISLPPGRFKIRAKDEADGYPDPSYWLNADPTAIFPEIIVDQKSIPNVRVILGRKGGVLDGEVLDLQSRGAVSGGKVTIRDAQNADAYVEVFTDASGHFRFTVPNKPLFISVTTAGYKTTAFAKGGEVVLSGGEHRSIVLELQHQ